ncbi:DgyrCDS10588 [Dimorphilus gyrociliatus]|uniref:DgyrCDS10588 n=1 Tax=Dimorphilus gyrociliatus TaxID=2664684 RepID=A0A7I8W0P2_9ANNE|nr:DgyrCDS10588 [Dimorphilus gyrociliatus]
MKSRSIFTYDVLLRKQPNRLTSSIERLKVFINTTSPLNELDDTYLSIGLDTGVASRHWNKGKFDFRSKKLLDLCQALSPATLRFGGNAADTLLFEPNSFMKSVKNFNFSGEDLTKLHTFTTKVGWKLMFDLNVLIRNHSKWDDTNTKKMLDFMIKNHQFQHFDFQLGNEPNAFKHTFNISLSPEELANDYLNLISVLRSPIYSKYFDKSLIVGPEITQPKNIRVLSYLKSYYLNGREAKMEDFLNETVMNKLEEEINNVKVLLRDLNIHKPIWITETSSAYGGGAPGLSDSFIAGFLWMEKLGMAAKLGVKKLFRQAIYGGNYALLDKKLNPLPDYWLTLLFKRLVGRKVFNVKLNNEDGVRAYCHCSNKFAQRNSLTLFVQNMKNCSVLLSAEYSYGTFQPEISVYSLTGHGPDGLLSKNVNLNGVKLALLQNRLPKLQPTISRSPITLPPYSFTFLLLQMDTRHILDTNSVVNRIDDTFLSVNIDGGAATTDWYSGVIQFSSKKFQQLCKNLAPASFRFGGTTADYLNYGDYPETPYSSKNFTILDYDTLYDFTKLVGWKLIFGVNALTRTSDGRWDSLNTKTLLDYIKSSNKNDLDFELGNEPDVFPPHLNITGARLAKDLAVFYRLIHSSRYGNYFKGSKLYSPDVTGPWISPNKYLKEYLSNIPVGTKLDAITIHHYYLDGRIAKLDDFLKIDTYDRLTRGLLDTLRVLKETGYEDTPLWLGETSSAFSGGAPGLSDVYVASFFWLDKLGVAAKLGLKKVARQQMLGGHYSLFDQQMNPNIDYWTSVLYKRLVGSAVFNTSTVPSKPGIRAYSHCSSKKYWNFPQGSLTFYAVNINNEPSHIHFGTESKEMLVFQLTSASDLKSKYAKLNGKILKYDGKMPDLKPELIYDSTIILPPYSLTFSVLPGANIDACKT